MMLFNVPVHAANASSGHGFSWFCVHRKDNLQPSADTTFSFIDKYDGYYIDKKHGDSCNEKVIYLTFDAGYENGNIESILNTLKEKNVHAAFFILSNLIRKNTELVIRMADEGHKVCNHTANHKNLTNLTASQVEDELKSLEALYYEKTGKRMSNYFRFPEGCYSEGCVERISLMGYKCVFWSLAYADWDNNNQPSQEYAFNKLLDNTHCGAIILLHPTSSTNAQILPRLIDAWRSMGYEFGSLDDIK